MFASERLRGQLLQVRRSAAAAGDARKGGEDVVAVAGDVQKEGEGVVAAAGEGRR